VSVLRRVAVIAKNGSEEAARTASELVDWLARRGVQAIPDGEIASYRAHLAARRGIAAAGPAETYRPENHHTDAPYDLAVVLGGDGTLLHVARSLASGPPILGVNLGRLGFLTEVGRAELYPALLQVLDGRFRVEERALFAVEHHVEPHRGDVGRARREPLRYLVLNDAVIAKSALARILELSLRIDGHLVAHYRSDGLIISTPTGSTAYNLSAGGPILQPQLPVMVVSPICPHTLTMRPLVVPDSSRLEISLDTPREKVFLTLDGQEGDALGFGDVVRVTRSDAAARLVRISGRSFFDNLRGKLHWGE
jgi:NAD+ kinase